MDHREEMLMRNLIAELKEINFHLKAISDSLKKDSDKREGAEKHEA